MTLVDVLVVGGGPSGLTTAAEAARAGARVVLVEKRAVAPVPRAGTVLPRPLELFDARGIADRFIRRTAEYNPHPFQTWHVWAGMHPVEWSVRDSRFGFTLYLSQHETEIILRSWAEECGVEIRQETELLDLTAGPDQVDATLRADGKTYDISARYVVGADGGRSRTREAAGIGFTGRDTSFTGIIATANLEFPWEGGARVVHNERGWLATFPFGPGLTRFTVVHADSRFLPVDEQVTAEELAKCVSEILGEHVDIPSLAVASRYGDAQRVADRLRAERIFLVGEAARVHYPASGVGMNFCIQDAFNLGWKLAAVLSGTAGASLLDTYESERRPIVDDLLRSVDGQVAVQFDFSEQGLAFMRKFEATLLPSPDVTSQLVAELNGLETPYAADGDLDGPALGQPVPDFELLTRDGSTVRLYELLREHAFVVLDLSGTPAIASDEVADLPAALIAAHPIRLPADLEKANALIVRPDTYLAWASHDVPGPGVVRGALRRALHLDVQESPHAY